ncbi:MAG: class I SAM-dependent methyltransferase [Thermodesulfobacteriota bacterium]
MEKQKFVQKEWYEHKPPIEGNEAIQISTLTHVKRLKDLFPVQKARLSLNCGCGSGGQKDIFGPSVGVDISFENIRLLIKSGGQGVVGDMEFLPFRDNTFDIVYGFGILHHLSNIKKGVSEATRVVKKGGYVGFGGENNGLCPLTYIMAFVYRNWKIEKGFYRIRERNLRKIFGELGIQEFRISRKGMTIYGLGETVYKLTSLGERFLSRIRFLNVFSGYCYFTGRKSY